MEVDKYVCPNCKAKYNPKENLNDICPFCDSPLNTGDKTGTSESVANNGAESQVPKVDNSESSKTVMTYSDGVLSSNEPKKRSFGRGLLNVLRVIFFIFLIFGDRRK